MGKRKRYRKPRYKWLRRMKNKLLGVCLSGKREGYAGFRVVRILRARFEKNSKQVVLLRVRCFGNDATKNGGYNGRIFTLDDRKEFVGSCRGIVEDKQYKPIDEYVIQLYRNATMAKKKDDKPQESQETVEPEPQQDEEYLTPAEDVDVEAPPLNLHQSFLPPLTAEEVQKLQTVLTSKPKLLSQRLVHEPRYTLRLTDGSVLDIAGYGYKSKGTPVKAEVLLIIGWSDKNDGGGYMGSTMPAAKVCAAIRKFVLKHTPARKVTPPSDNTKPVISLEEAVSNDDYF